MLWQGAKWRILKNFNVQNEECHNYVENVIYVILFLVGEHRNACALLICIECWCFDMCWHFNTMVLYVCKDLFVKLVFTQMGTLHYM
jgi:hypothetical protein